VAQSHPHSVCKKAQSHIRRGSYLFCTREKEDDAYFDERHIGEWAAEAARKLQNATTKQEAERKTAVMCANVCMMDKTCSHHSLRLHVYK
jgi:phage terminase Nu1 subunit (DNA packaging protein)